MSRRREIFFCFFCQPMDSVSIPHMARARLLVVIVSAWPLLILANAIPNFEQPYRIIGYHWKIEFFIGLFLFAAIAYLFARRDRILAPVIHTPGVPVLLPLVLFVIWSGLSISWAVSWRNAMHHTLLWGCYLIFFLLIYNLLRARTFLPTSLLAIGGVALAVSGCCLIEYLGNSGRITWDYTYRYYRFAEALGLFIPVFFALALTQKGRVVKLSMLVALSGWLLVLLSLSRTMLISTVIGLAIFFGLALKLKTITTVRRKIVLGFGLAVALFAVTQFPAFVGGESTTVARVASSNIESQTSANARYLFWGIAIEAFENSPLIGVGADDYISTYKFGRDQYAQRDPSNPINEINENVIPERAHSEYLQILSELGIVGLGLFAAFLFGAFRLVIAANRAKLSLLTLGALSGILVFLISSAASSYSFREPGNGLAFFFVLAVAVVGLERHDSRKLGTKKGLMFSTSKLSFGIALIICIATVAFSLERGISEYYLERALSSGDNSLAVSNLKTAILLDESDPTFRYYYADGLQFLGDPKDAALEYRFAIDHGVATSNAYYSLASTQVASGAPRDAEATYLEALQVYPRSVFLRTAFASFLKRAGQADRAEDEFKAAININEKQARSWQLAHDEGLEQLVKTSRVDSGYVSTFDLKPDTATLVVANSQRNRVQR
jgi:O-antigen ligase